jgi:hypothetical protein
MKNRAAIQLGRRGGQATSTAKTAANRAKALAYWQAVRSGAVTHKGRGKDKRKRAK